MQTVTVLARQDWNIQQDDGSFISGTTIHYVDMADIYTEEDKQGCFPAKITIPENLIENIETLPGKYDLDFSATRGAGGKAKLVLKDLKYVASSTVSK